MRLPSLISYEQFDRDSVHLGFVGPVELLPGGSNPGPASKMVYPISCNDIAGPFTRAVPSLPRWGDEWDCDPIPEGTPVGVFVAGGRVYILAREERHAGECDP